MTLLLLTCALVMRPAFVGGPNPYEPFLGAYHAMSARRPVSGSQGADDRLLRKWLAEFNAPAPTVLWLTDHPVRSEIAMVYDVTEGEKLLEAWRGTYGLVVLEYDYPFSDQIWALEYMTEALVPGGSVLVLDGRRRILMRVFK